MWGYVKPGMLAALMAVVLGGCGSGLVAELKGEVKKSPDEFSVYARPPLSIPPVYGLRAPKPGQDQEESISSRDEALLAIVRRKPIDTVPAEDRRKFSPGTLELLKDARTEEAVRGIRKLVNEETAQLNETDFAFMDKLIFWVDLKPEDPDLVVDAAAEQRRILENQALGRSINEGKVPEVKRKSGGRGILDLLN